MMNFFGVKLKKWSEEIVPKSYVVYNPNCIVQYNKQRPYDVRQAALDVQEMEAHQHIFNMYRAAKIENHKLAEEQ